MGHAKCFQSLLSKKKVDVGNMHPIFLYSTLRPERLFGEKKGMPIVNMGELLNANCTKSDRFWSFGTNKSAPHALFFVARKNNTTTHGVNMAWREQKKGRPRKDFNSVVHAE